MTRAYIPRPKVSSACAVCRQPFTGSAGRRFCSGKCRSKLRYFEVKHGIRTVNRRTGKPTTPGYMPRPRQAKPCQSCGGIFQAKGARVYCSQDCRAKGARDHGIANYVRNKQKLAMTCAHCGTDFRTGQPGAKYCSRTCFAAASRKVWRCDRCGDVTVRRKRGRRKSGDRQGVFCSRRCYGLARTARKQPKRESPPTPCLHCGTMKPARVWYCSDRCAETARDSAYREFKARKRVEYRAARPLEVRECARCCKPFMPSFSDAMYCSAGCCKRNAANSIARRLIRRNVTLRGVQPRDIPKPYINAWRELTHVRFAVKNLKPTE